MSCQFLYVLDDDNLIHENLINVIRKNIDKYLIINRLDLSDKQKTKQHILNIECPLELSEYNCIGKIDYANCVFNITALKSVGGFSLTNGALYSDGTTIQILIQNGIEPTYSNEIAGYYNKLQIEE